MVKWSSSRSFDCSTNTRDGTNSTVNTNNQPKILIVDDDPISGMILEGYLQPDNYQIHYVDNGEKALKLVKDINPDLIILDIMMPGISGRRRSGSFYIAGVLSSGELVE